MPDKGKDEPRINEEIDAKSVRLIDSEGNMLGVLTIQEALAKAYDAGLDLIEVSPDAAPPVCKILDYGKYRYQQNKKKQEAKKKQKVVELKEIKLRPGIGQNDYDVKLRHVRKFLEAGNKVKITMQYRRREITHAELGMKVLEQMKVDTADIAKVEFMPKLEGRNAIMILAPEKA